MNDEGDPPGLLTEFLIEYDLSFEVVSTQNANLQNIYSERPGAIISLGGRQYAGDSISYLQDEQDMIRYAVHQDIPFLGVCLGGQLLAHALGAEVAKGELTEIGFYTVQLTQEGKLDPLYQNFTEGVQQVFHWHSDVFELPFNSTLLATGSGIPQAFRYGRRAYGLQYHIELTPDTLTNWLAASFARDEAIQALGEKGYNSIEQTRTKLYPIYKSHTAILFRNFLRLSQLI